MRNDRRRGLSPCNLPGYGDTWNVAVGLLAPPLAAWPAIHRGVRVDLRQALEATGSAVGGQDAGDRLLRRVRLLPRSPAPSRR